MGRYLVIDFILVMIKKLHKICYNNSFYLRICIIKYVPINLLGV